MRADTIAAAAAVGALVVAAVALVISMLAYRRAGDANDIADRSAKATQQSANEAAEANRLTRDALQIARTSEARADRAEALARERRDVRWEVQQVGDNSVRFRNVGADDAHNVVLLMEVNDDRRELRHGVVAAGTAITLDLEAEARATHAARRNRMPDSSGMWPPEIRLLVRGTITWTSASGVPAVIEVSTVRLIP